MRLFVTAMILTALSVAAPLNAGTQSGVLGYWSTPRGSTVRVYTCSSGVCAQLVHLSAKLPEKLDMKNPNPALRKKPLCELEIGRGFQLAGPDQAKGGMLYDPESGKRYHGEMASAGDELKLRGYVGIALFGRTEVWHRTQAAERCMP